MSRLSPGPKLSVALIVRNAAEALDETLASIRTLADEIVVVDTGSTDPTPDVAARHGARLFATPWRDDFSAARNHAADLCAGEWILWLDAGERLSSEAARGLKNFLEQQAQPDTAYMMVVRVPPQPGEIAGEQIGAIRLVPNDPALRFTRRVRETLLPALNLAKLQVEGLPFRIERGLRELDRELKLRRAKRNIQLAELEIRERGPHPALLNCLAEAFLTLGQAERAVQFFRQAIGHCERGSSDMLAACYGLVMALEGSDRGRAAQLDACVAALEIFPIDAQLLCAAGGYLQSMGQLVTATRAYEMAHRHGRVNPEVWHLSGVAEVAASCYALALEQGGRPDDARVVLEEELERSPDCLRLRRQLMRLSIAQRDRKRALLQVDRLPPETPYREALKSAVRGACLAVENQWVPAAAYLEEAYRHGCRDPLGLEWYSRALLMNGQAAAALPVLEEWQRREPRSTEAAALCRDVAAAVAAGRPFQLAEQMVRYDACASMAGNGAPEMGGTIMAVAAG
jgi:tetratricopeptide (TPR) repeat protein